MEACDRDSLRCNITFECDRDVASVEVECKHKGGIYNISTADCAIASEECYWNTTLLENTWSLRPPIAILCQRGGECNQREELWIDKGFLRLKEGSYDRKGVVNSFKGFLMIGEGFMVLWNGFLRLRKGSDSTGRGISCFRRVLFLKKVKTR